MEINWDITARKRAERELEELNRTLERRVRERTRELSAQGEELEAFAYTVAHDLRAPLRSISGFASAVTQDYAPLLDEDGRDMLGRIRASAERMDELIRDLLAYSHLGRAELRPGPVSLDGVFGSILAGLRAEVEAGGAEVDLAGPLGTVWGHEATVWQVAANLLGNALKFVAPGVRPRVRVWAETRGGLRRVWVEDNGIGVDVRHEQRIFRVFERLHTLEAYPGTGVGLAIVRKGLERMNGRVGVRPREGAAAVSGSSCRSLPGRRRERGRAARRGQRGRRAVHPAGVWRHRPRRDAAGGARRRAGPGGTRGAPPPDLVLLDLRLPRLGGLEVLAWLRAQAHLARVPVVVLTTSHEPRDVRGAYDVGATSYLVKPVNAEALRTLVQTLGLYWLRLNTPAPDG